MSTTVFAFHYTLKDKDGTVVDSSEGQTPLAFLQGSGQVIPSLESVIVTLAVGDKKDVEIKAADAYGEVVEDLRLIVKKSQFPEDATIILGDQFQVNEEPDAPIFTIMNIEGEDVHIDGNHPMAGQDLFFAVELTEKREATEDEIAHGHVHGEGCNH